MEDSGHEKFNYVRIGAFPHSVDIINVDVMNQVYQLPPQDYKTKTVSACMLQSNALLGCSIDGLGRNQRDILPV